MSVETEINALESALQNLRIAYEKYIAGVERIEPLRQRERFRKQLRAIQQQRINNTALRFRLQTLQSSFVTHEQYWNRVGRQIEEGTFRRFRERPPTKAAPTAPSGAAPSAQRKDIQQYPASIRKLYESYVSTRERLGDGRPVSIDKLARTVRSQYQRVKEQYNCHTVEFKVAVKDGRAILKAVPK